VKVKDLKLLGDCPLDGNYPFVARQSFAPEYIRQKLHFRSRVSSFNSMVRCRHTLSNIINNYLYNEGFIQIHTPILTANDCEGAGEVFRVTPDNDGLLKTMRKDEKQHRDEIYFDEKVFLTVSGQLHLEAMTHGLSKVFTFGPTFRAENCKSSIHLSEFYMLELEEAFIDSLDDVIFRISDMFRKVGTEFREKCLDDILLINKSNKEFNIDEHFNWLGKDFKVMTFNEAFQIVEKNQDKFMHQPKFEDGLSKENELFLANYCQGPLYVVDWPKNQKSFYMRQKKSNLDLVEALDFIVPNVGEVVGGSVREDDYERLKSKLPNVESLQWYLDLRKYGNVTTGGFGLGYERLLQYFLKIPNIKDTIPYPRWAHNCSM
jgi:asparaginyl-tRNA synthetase